MMIDEETTPTTDGETVAERAAYHQQLADELAEAMQQGIYPMNVVSYMWGVLETALKRNDIGFNHAGYTKAVVPYLLALSPEYEETVICLTLTLRECQKEARARATAQ